MKLHKPKIDLKQSVIRIAKLEKSFDSFKVLKGVNLNLYKGENLVVMGRSGSGKSVLIKLIAGLLKPDKGEVCVFNTNVATLTDKELQEIRVKIGFSFQGSALYDSMSVRKNLEFPLVRLRRHLKKHEVNAAVESVLEEVGLLQAINQMPSELSGGQRKRIGIARTLILNPEIMLYDEPTAGLDPITSNDINSLINNVQERFHTSSIIITHDLTCAKNTGDRMMMLIEGKFEREGSFEEIFDTNDEKVRPFYDYNFIN